MEFVALWVVVIGGLLAARSVLKPINRKQVAETKPDTNWRAVFREGKTRL